MHSACTENKNQDYHVEGTNEGKVFYALGAVSAIIVSNTSGMLLEIQVKSFKSSSLDNCTDKLSS